MSDETKESSETPSATTETARPPAEQTAPGGSKFDDATAQANEAKINQGQPLEQTKQSVDQGAQAEQEQQPISANQEAQPGATEKVEPTTPGAEVASKPASETPTPAQNAEGISDSGAITPPEADANDQENKEIRRQGEQAIEQAKESGQIERKWKHASDFGVEGNYNKANAEQAVNAMKEHINAPDTEPISGVYRGNIPVTHFFNPNTELNVMVNKEDNTFRSGWKLSQAQIASLRRNNNIQ